jgi:hypothetical protein
LDGFWALDTVCEVGLDSNETESDPHCVSPGYARVSTIDQDLRLQRAALKAAGYDVIRAEKASGSRRDGRTELQVLLDFVRPGEALIVTRIDRLARSMKDLQDIVHVYRRPSGTPSRIPARTLNWLEELVFGWGLNRRRSGPHLERNSTKDIRALSCSDRGFRLGTDPHMILALELQSVLLA